MDSPPSSAAGDGGASTSTRRTLRIPEDTVVYAIYPSSTASLHHLLSDIFSPLIHDYIWQHEPFHLFPSIPNPQSPNPNASCPVCGSPEAIPHLHGRTRFGDNLEDEWFIVAILYEITRAFPNLAARAWDNDGEFLLIEAAAAIPKWLHPSTATNRVFIRRGELQIVPKSLFPSNPSLMDALGAVLDDEVDTRASDAVQALTEKRIDGYPDRARANMHRARVLVPLPVAQVLKHEPGLISLAVEGFYDRDIDSMKHASRMDKFLRSGNGGIEMVRVPVRMSRVMYAQLVQQRFQAPKCYPMPGREEGPGVFLEAELGLKIACGFEMMYQERLRAGKEEKGETWEAFRRSLERSGYFVGLLPGSKDYKRVMDAALNSYKSNSLYSRTRNMSGPVQRVDEILALPHSFDDFNGIELPPNDDDSWLYDGEAELNSNLLERRKEIDDYESEHGKHRKTIDGVVADDSSAGELDDFGLGDIAQSMQAFIQKISSFEGAEVPENRDSEAVELDVDKFMKDVESAFGPTGHEEAVNSANREERSASSSDMEFDEDGDVSDLGEEFDMDDDFEDTFMKSYSGALNRELADTTLQKSFVRADQPSNDNDQATSRATEDLNEELAPIDVDVNLVKSFLDSFSSQQGLSGPASNLLGLMGVKVPPPDSREK